MRSEARGAQEALKEELRKIQRHLAGVTGIKDAEIERLQTRVETQVNIAPAKPTLFLY